MDAITRTFVSAGRHFPEDSVLTGRLVLDRRDVTIVALVSGLMGLFLGIASGWQVALESAQVVAGIVQYPHDNPFAMYHLKTWTLLHQVPAALLALGVPERMLAMAIGGLTGLISFTALALCAYACGASRLLSSMTPVALLGCGIYGEISSVYPIRVLSNAPWVLYGCIGTSLVLLVWSMIAVDFKRAAALLMGLSPAIHPTLGAWCIAIGGLAFVWSWRRREELRGPTRWLFAGLMITAASLALHLHLSREVPDIPAAEKAQYIAAFAANWDSHRRPFPMDHLVMLTACLSVVLSGVWLRFFRDRLPDTTQFLLRSILLSAVISIGLCASTQWQEYLPTSLLMAMPGRYINIVALAFPALCLGLLYRNRPTLLGHAMLCGFILYLALIVQRLELGRVYVPMPGLVFLACSFALLAHLRNLVDSSVNRSTPCLIRLLAWLGPAALALLAIDVGLKDRDFGLFLWIMLAGVVVLKRWPTPQANWIVGWLELAHAPCLWTVAAMMLGVPFAFSLMSGWMALLMFEHPGMAERLLQFIRLFFARRSLATALSGLSAVGIVYFMILQARTAYPELADWQNHTIYARAHRGSGFLLTASNIRATQLRTRRPVLLEGPALNQLPYVPESGPSMNHILKHVYGEDLFADRPDAPRGGGLTKESGRKLWEGRNLEEWQALAREFGFTQIVTYSTWDLKLPLVAQNTTLSLYDVPGAKPLRR